MRDVTYDLLNPDGLHVFYDPKNPELKNYETLKEQIERVHKTCTNLIVKDEQESHDLSKRGGLLTKLRKISNGLNECQRRVHRKAKESYMDFDSKINDLKIMVDESINAIRKQVDDFNEKEQIQMINECHKIFDEVINSKQFKDKLPKWVTWKWFFKFNSKLYHESKKKQNELIIKKLADVYHDIDKMIQKYHELNSDWFIKAAIHEYQLTMDFDKSMSAGYEEKERADEIAKIERQKLENELAEKKKQEKESLIAEKQNEQKSQQEVISNEDHKKKSIYLFGIPGRYDAKIFKDFLDERHIKYQFKLISK